MVCHLSFSMVVLPWFQIHVCNFLYMYKSFALGLIKHGGSGVRANPTFTTNVERGSGSQLENSFY